jgi:hypothetical protein
LVGSEWLKGTSITLSGDIQFKGYEDVVVRDVIFRTDN